MGREFVDQQTVSRAAGLMTCRRQKTLSADSDKIDTKPILEFQRRKSGILPKGLINTARL
jgi:hypothetical protein